MLKRISAVAVPLLSAVVVAAVTVLLFSSLKISGKRVRTVVKNFGEARATDHDDGDYSGKTADVDLTDHFAFREDTATNAPDGVNRVVFGQLTNASLSYPPGAETPFNTTALYEIHVTRVKSADRTAQATGNDDIIFRFQFTGAAAPQGIHFTVIQDGATVYNATQGASGAFTTTTLAGAATPTVNTLTTSKGDLTFFAGLRRDPAAHDRARFALVRDYALARFINGDTTATLANTCDGATSPIKAGTTANFFNPAGCATNAYATKNVNAIVLTVPIAFLQRTTSDTVFDSWSTTSLPTDSLKGIDDGR